MKRPFGSFMNRQKAGFNTALSYMRSREDAEEITQDVYVDVFRLANTFKGEASPTTWLYRITVNKSLDFIKH